jgi:hypothetical protein
MSAIEICKRSVKMLGGIYFPPNIFFRDLMCLSFSVIIYRSARIELLFP